MDPKTFLDFFDKRVGDLILVMGALDKTLQKLIVTLENKEPWH